MPDSSKPSSDAVEDFYDDFSAMKIAEYRLNGNRRIDRAIARILPLVQRSTRALDIGCGGGIVTEKIAKRAEDGVVVGIDISQTAIDYAEQTIPSENAAFYRLDVIEEFDQVTENLDEPPDLVTLVDVIEHIPPARLGTLFDRIDELSTSDAHIVCTFPSPEYQELLSRKSPEKLQVIDESITLERLQDVLAGTNFQIVHFSYEHVWKENQYIHCVLSKSVECARNASDVERERHPIRARVDSALQKTIAFGRRLARPYLKYRYILGADD